MIISSTDYKKLNNPAQFDIKKKKNWKKEKTPQQSIASLVLFESLRVVSKIRDTLCSIIDSATGNYWSNE